ncbi:MAG: glycosyl transferase family 2 [uncultured bacterium]|nr:MAG: glycosyl transferase family 2 [uncultured bacterium]HBD05013.1 glycosyl transferase family 2 [Candidatus Uhrbacteria bacterium]
MNKASAIIPAYNEEQTIASVVLPIKNSGLFEEIIVVSDGSTDNTAHQARSAGATVYEFDKNIGKGNAMRFGASKTSADILAFFDADLIGLREDHVSRLLSPVSKGHVAMNSALRDRGRFATALSRFLPIITGERALKREIFDSVPEKYKHGFMIEAAINYACKIKKLPRGVIVFDGVSMRRKYQKVSAMKAFAQYVIMFIEIAKATLLIRLDRIFGKF